jgi:hypothetical protein
VSLFHRDTIHRVQSEPCAKEKLVFMSEIEGLWFGNLDFIEVTRISNKSALYQVRSTVLVFCCMRYLCIESRYFYVIQLLALLNGEWRTLVGTQNSCFLITFA